jgi:hypothetical protein
VSIRLAVVNDTEYKFGMAGTRKGARNTRSGGNDEKEV